MERLNETTLAVRAALDVYDSEKATQVLEAYLDDLSNWYVRRSRRRFWKSEGDADKHAAYATLYHVLVEYVKLIAPFVPFASEAIYQNLVADLDPSAPRSVHHTFYPQADVEKLDRRLLDKMGLAITTASLGRAARGAADIKLRQPLAKARVNVGTLQAQQDLMELDFVLQEEINVKEIEVVSEVGDLVSYVVLPNSRSLGPKFGNLFPQVRVALLAENPAELARTLQAGGVIQLMVAGQTVELTGEDVLVQTESKGGTAVASDKGVTVAVDTELTPELVQEGYARDIVRQVNNARKDAGLEISDRIALSYRAEGDVAAAFIGFAEFIQQETLTVSLTAVSLENPTYMETVKIGDQEVVLALRKAQA